MFILTSLKTEIARSVRGPKSQGPHAEDAIVGAVPRAEKFGDLTTADHRSSVTIANLETIIDMESWCKTCPPNGSSCICAKQKFLQETQTSLQKFLEPREREKERKWRAGEGKKRAKFWAVRRRAVRRRAVWRTRSGERAVPREGGPREGGPHNPNHATPHEWIFTRKSGPHTHTTHTPHTHTTHNTHSNTHSNTHTHTHTHTQQQHTQQHTHNNTQQHQQQLQQHQHTRTNTNTNTTHTPTHTHRLSWSGPTRSGPNSVWA